MQFKYFTRVLSMKQIMEDKRLADWLDEGAELVSMVPYIMEAGEGGRKYLEVVRYLVVIRGPKRK